MRPVISNSGSVRGTQICSVALAALAVIALSAVAATFVLRWSGATATVALSLHPASLADGRNLPAYFEENRGQTDPRVRFMSRGPGYTVFLTQQGTVLALRKTTALAQAVSAGQKSATDPHQKAKFTSAAVWMNLVGARPDAQVQGIDPLPGRVNYFIGSDPSKWHSGIPTYARVRYRSIYPGIDLIYYGTPQALEYDIIVSPGADPTAIRFALAGASSLALNKVGDIVMATPAGAVTMRKPSLYEEDASGSRRPIDGHYVILPQDGVMKGASVRNVMFALADHDCSRRLVIDPQIIYSSYIGGDGSDGGTVQGFAAFQVLSTHLSTALLPNVADVGLDVAAGKSNFAYVAGLAYSIDFPTTKGAYQMVNKGKGHRTPNAFVAAFNTTKSGTPSLAFSTYLGGSGSSDSTKNGDEATGIAVDAAGNSYLVGITYSKDFPTHNGFETTNNQANQDINNGFAAIVSSNGTKLLYSSFIHGSHGAPPSRVALKPGCTSNCVMYVSGSTTTTNKTGQDFPTTANAFQSKNPDNVGNSAAYVFVLDPTKGTNGDLYSTFLGGTGKSTPKTTGGDGATGIAVDSSGLVYLTGFTYSAGTGHFPITGTAFQSVNNANTNNQTNAFLSVIDPTQKSGSATLKYSTYLGGAGDPKLGAGAAADVGADIALDPLTAGNVWLTGFTFSSSSHAPGFPTKNPLQVNNNATAIDSSNAFVTELNTKASGAAGLVYSSYLGGAGFSISIPEFGVSAAAGDAATGIRLDPSGNVYITGATASSNFPHPTTGNIGCYKSKPGLGSGFLVKLSHAGKPIVFSTYFGGTDSPYIDDKTLGFISPTGLDVTAGLALDSSNHVYITGASFSKDMPATSTAYQDINMAATQNSSTTGDSNAFVAEFDTTSSDCGLKGLATPVLTRTP